MSVHALSEFAFCLRAGLCLYEQDDPHTEVIEDVDVSYLPIFERTELEQMLKAYSTEFCRIEKMGVRVDDEGYTVPDEDAQPFNVAMEWTDLDGFYDDLVERLMSDVVAGS